MRYFLLFLYTFALLPLLQAAPLPAAKGDEAYKQKNYAAAAQAYEQCLKQDAALANDPAAQATLHYNLGNAYYRLKNYAKAVLCYQRSLRLEPANSDAAFNLKLTQAKLTDRFDAPAEMFFISWAKSLVQGQSWQTWGQRGLWAIALALLCFGLYRFSRRMWLRKAAFALCALFVLQFLCCQLFAWLQNDRFEHLEQAVIMQTADTYDTPTGTAQKQHTLHEGTTVTIADTYKGGWLQIVLPDDNRTWIKESQVERIAPRAAE